MLPGSGETSAWDNERAPPISAEDEGLCGQIDSLWLDTSGGADGAAAGRPGGADPRA